MWAGHVAKEIHYIKGNIKDVRLKKIADRRKIYNAEIQRSIQKKNKIKSQMVEEFRIEVNMKN